MVADRLAIALLGVEEPMHFRGCGLTGARLPHLRQAQQTCAKAHLLQHPPLLCNEVFDQGQDGFDLALDVEIVEEVRLAQARLIGRDEHPAQGSWVLKHQRAARGCCRVRFPGGAIPQAYGNIASRSSTQYVLEQGQCDLNGLIGGLRCYSCHWLVLSGCSVGEPLVTHQMASKLYASVSLPRSRH